MEPLRALLQLEVGLHRVRAAVGGGGNVHVDGAIGGVAHADEALEHVRRDAAHVRGEAEYRVEVSLHVEADGVGHSRRNRDEVVAAPPCVHVARLFLAFRVLALIEKQHARLGRGDLTRRVRHLPALLVLALDRLQQRLNVGEHKQASCVRSKPFADGQS